MTAVVPGVRSNLRLVNSLEARVAGSTVYAESSDRTEDQMCDLCDTPLGRMHDFEERVGWLKTAAH